MFLFKNIFFFFHFFGLELQVSHKFLLSSLTFTLSLFHYSAFIVLTLVWFRTNKDGNLLIISVESIGNNKEYE